MEDHVIGGSWNPVTGCTKYSVGCTNCYAEVMALRLQGMKTQNGYANGFKLTLHPSRVNGPRKLEKPYTFFVNSMSDLFHKDVPIDFIQAVFKTMNECPQHTFRVLTKRSDILVQHAPHLTWSENIWMGVTVERSDYLFRIDDLRKVPTKNRFLSLEPLLGPLNNMNLDGIGWVIVGGESGIGFRPVDTDWIRDIRDQCIKVKIPFYFKQYAGIGVKKLGKELDGREWTEKPPIVPYVPPKPILPLRVLLPPKPFVPFSPKRVFVNSKFADQGQTELYLDKIRTNDPYVDITEYDGKFHYPEGMNAAEMFHYMKDTVLISERSLSSPFFETFPSPGNCVENINTMVKSTWQCVGKCHYCYLLLTEPHEHYFYTNLDRFEDEFATAIYAHRVIMSVWYIASETRKTIFPKIPFHLRNVSEKIRGDMNAVGIVSDDDAKEYLYQHHTGSILENLKYFWSVDEKDGTLPCPYNEDNFQRSLEAISTIYDRCAKLPFDIHPCEYADLVAVDHLTGHIDYLIKLLSRYPDVSMSIRTKFTNLEGFQNNDGMGRVKFQMNFNTPYAIQEFEPNAPPLEDRIAALRKMQESDGYITEAVIEPIIPYSGHRQDYIDLVKSILSGIHKERLSAFTIGAVRYKVSEGSLPKTILRNFPDTKIFETEEHLQVAEKKDGRKRYPIDWRVSIYSELSDIIRNEIPRVKIKIGADIPEVWERLNMDIKNYMDESVFQFNSNGQPMTRQQDPNVTKVPEDSEKRVMQNQTVSPPKQISPLKAMEDKTAKASRNYHVAVAELGSTAGRNSQVLSDRSSFLDIDQVFKNSPSVEDEAQTIWDNIFAKRIIGALKEPFYSPVKIVGWIADISQPVAVKPKNVAAAETYRGFYITIVDDENESIKSLLVPLTKETEKYYDYKKINKRVVFCGAVVPITGGRSQDTRFYLWNIIPFWTPQDLIGLDQNKTNKDLITKFTQIQTKKFGVFDYIKEQVVAKVGIQGLNNLPELERTIEVMILQAISDGMSSKPRYSFKIHTLVMSTAGQGKKFLIDIASILNPAFAKASTVGGKVNVAGLIGNIAGRRKSKTITAPGLLPLSSGGVVSFEDIHQLGQGRSAVLAALSEVMEDGRVTDSNSARTVYEAVTSIHVDMNRKSDVGDASKDNPFKDINIPYNIISRFDYIIQLPSSLDRMVKTFNDIQSEGFEASSYEEEDLVPQWQRDLKVLVAYMRTYWRSAIFTKEVDAYIKAQVLKELKLDGTAPKTLSDKTIQDNINRIKRSVIKFSKAIACIDHQPTVTNEIVDRAMTYVRDKIKFLEIFQDENTSDSDPRLIRVDQRLQDSLKKLDTTFRTRDYAALFKEELNEKAAQVKADRDLTKLKNDNKIRRLGQGRWEIVERTDGKKKAETKKPIKKTTKKAMKTAKKQGAKKKPTRKKARK